MMIRPGRLRRYREVTTVLARHGFGLMLWRFGAGRLMPFHRGWFGHARRDQPYTEAEHLRLALEELGVTFIKLGQILSTRPDILPPEYIEELAKLRDSVPAVEVAAIRATIEEELAAPISELFAEFDDEPLASASIGQVHAARLRDGTEVVVKVQKPGVPERVEADLAVLRQMAEGAERRSETARRYGARALVEEFAWQLRSELDYVREGRNAERFADQFRDNRALHVPTVHWRHTTRAVLTMERVGGIRIGDVDALAAAGIDRHSLAEQSARIVFESVFRHGFYHADPHPGNFFVQPGGRIAVLDFGMMGRVPDEMRMAMVHLLMAAVGQHTEQVVDSLAEFGVRPPPDAREAFVRDVQHVLDAYYGLDLGEISAARFIDDLTAIARRHSLRLPASLSLLLKTIAMNEGVGRALDPSFNLVSVAEPFARDAIGELRSPVAFAKRATRSAIDSAALAVELPERARRILRQVEGGDFEVRLRRDEIDAALDGFGAIINRLAAAIVGAAVAVAVAIVMLAYHPPAWRVVAAVFLFAGPIAVGALWSWAMFSARRRD